MALDSTVYNQFKRAFEQICFQLIIEAYQTSLTGRVVKLDWNENDISSELHRHIKENPLRLKYRIFSHIEAHIPKNTPKEKGFADKFPRIDFCMATFALADEYEYFLEAKNLKENDAVLKRRYIDTGIDNFVSGKYVNGSLVGYLLEGRAKETIDGINKLLKKDKRYSEVLIPKKNDQLKFYYESRHLKIGILKHLIFDLTPLC